MRASNSAYRVGDSGTLRDAPPAPARPGIARPCTLDRPGAWPLPWSATTRAELGGPEPLVPGLATPGRRGGAVRDAGFRSPDPEPQCRSPAAVAACSQVSVVRGYQPHSVPSQQHAQAALPRFLAAQSYSQAAWVQGVAGLSELTTS